VVIVAGALMCLLLAGVVYGAASPEASTIAPKATNESSVPLNNSVVAAATKDEATSTTEKPPCTNCNSDEASKLADPAAKVNTIDMNKYVMHLHSSLYYRIWIHILSEIYFNFKICDALR